MKIVFLCRDYGQVNRGAETFTGELAKNLQSLGHLVEIHKDTFDNIPSDARAIISTNGRLDALLTRIWCLSKRVKMIIVGQSGFGWDDKLNLWLFPNVFVALTQYQKEWAHKINPLVKIEVIPNGVDLTKFNPQVKPVKINMPKPVILNVGVVDSFKRQFLLKKASKHSVLLVGKGGDLEVEHKDMPSVYTACDLFSYPTSERESFGIVMLEAMASGLAVVATDDPIRREIVGDAGLFVDPNNIDEYAKTLDRALSTDWGDKPRKQAEKFSWEAIAKAYEKILA